MAKVDQILFFIERAFNHPQRTFDDRGLKTELVYPSLIVAHNQLLDGFLKIREFKKVMTVTSFYYSITVNNRTVKVIFQELTHIGLDVYYGDVGECIITDKS